MGLLALLFAVDVAMVLVLVIQEHLVLYVLYMLCAVCVSSTRKTMIVDK